MKSSERPREELMKCGLKRKTYGNPVVSNAKQKYKKCHKQQIKGKCRMRSEREETVNVQFLVVRLWRQERVVMIIRWELCNTYDFPATGKWFRCKVQKGNKRIN